MIRIDITENLKNWNKIKKEHCLFFKEHIRKELSNLLIEDNKYIAKRKKPNKDEPIIYYSLSESDRKEIEEIFGGEFTSKKDKSVFNIMNEEKIESIICGSLEEVCGIFEKSSLEKKVIEEIFNYDKFRDNIGWNRHKLISMMNISVCPYCNRQYITSYEDNKTKLRKTTADLDHYYSQEKHPYLALTLYNFIPSCQICNSRFKKKADFKEVPHIYPYIEEFGENSKFKIKGESLDYLLGQSNDFDIYLDTKVSDYQEKIKHSIETFHLNDVYKIHTDYVQDIIKKTIMYTDDKIEEILLEYPDLFKSKQEICNTIYGNDNKRILSKLTYDICDEFGINIK